MALVPVHFLELESAVPALGTYHPGTRHIPAGGLLAWGSDAERNRHLSGIFHKTYFRHLL